MQTVQFSIPILDAVAWSAEPLLPPEPGGHLKIDSGPPVLGFLDPLLRRRLGPLGRAMLHCAGRVSEGRGPLPSVFASRHGDVARTVPLLEDLARGFAPSPTQFSMNVHNAVAGVWSIARQDPSPSISLAAGPETFAWGMVEAFGLHGADPGQPVLFVYGDEPLPTPFQGFAELEAPLHAVALLVGLPVRTRLILSWTPGQTGPAAALPQSLQACQALQSGNPQGPWAESSGTWAWSLDAAP